MLGLCINYENANYGGKLQCFALISFLKENGLKYEIVRYNEKKNIFYYFKSFPRLFNIILLNDKLESFKKKIGQYKHKTYREETRIRDSLFDDFTSNYLKPLSPIYHSFNELRAFSKRYSVVLSGSDQLWSPAGLPRKFYTLQFCDKSVRRVSYGSSFGVGYIPWYQKKRTKQYLSQMNQITFREKQGSKIAGELIGKEFQVVLDPVFLLSAAEWKEKSQSAAIPYEHYIFAYFLGNNPASRSLVSSFAKSHHLKIVSLKHLDQYVSSDQNFGDYSPYNIGPFQFLYLIEHANYVFTDSFHGTAFSIILQKQFCVFRRYKDSSKISKNSRIYSLLDSLGLQDRLITTEINPNSIDYEAISTKLSPKVSESQKTLLSMVKEGGSFDESL